MSFYEGERAKMRGNSAKTRALHPTLIGAFCMRMAEHREPYDLRESRTVLGARGGEIPPRDSPGRAQNRRYEALAVASRRPDRHRARCSGPTPTRHASGQAVVAQTAEEADAAT